MPSASAYVLMLYEKNSVTISVEPLSVIRFSEICAVACGHKTHPVSKQERH